MQPECKREGCNCPKHPEHHPYCCAICSALDHRFDHLRRKVRRRDNTGKSTDKLRAEWVALCEINSAVDTWRAVVAGSAAQE